VPSQERLRLHNRKQAPPVDESGEDDQRESRGVVEAARLPSTLAVKGQLLAKKEMLGGQVRMRAQAEREQLQESPIRPRKVRGSIEGPIAPVHAGYGGLENSRYRHGLSGQIVSARIFAEDNRVDIASTQRARTGGKLPVGDVRVESEGSTILRENTLSSPRPSGSWPEIPRQSNPCEWLS
jgi:hypothetical protein